MTVLLAFVTSAALALAAVLVLRIRALAGQLVAAQSAVVVMNERRVGAALVADQRLTAWTRAERRAQRAELLLATERDETRELREKLENAEQMLAFEAARWEVGPR